MKITLGAAVCLAIAVINLIFPGGPNTSSELPYITNGILLLVSVYLIIKGMAYTEAATTEISTLSEQLAEKPSVVTAPPPAPSVGAGAVINKARQLEAELATANRRLTELDAKHKDAIERREALQTAIEAMEARAVADEARRAAESESAVAKSEAAVVGFLALLQSKGRFVDFLMDDITPHDDRQVGAAARIVHQGCRAVLGEHFDIAPLREDGEGAAVTVDKDEPAGKYRLVGRVVGQPPFRGTLLHRGWVTRKVKLPRPVEPTPGEATAHLPKEVIQPAEIELR